MAKNTGNGGRRGPISDRTQTYNEKTNQYVKRDANTGRFLSSKDTPYKSVRKEGNLKEANTDNSKNTKNNKK